MAPSSGAKIVKIKAKITMARMYGGGDPSICIEISDDASGIQFFDGTMTLERFAEAVTGHGCVEIDAEVRGLENIGKKRIVELRQITCPLETFSTEKLEAWLVENGQEPGWILNSYLRSQKSVVHRKGETILNYSVCKYV
jgi:hypothetical protein